MHSVQLGETGGEAWENLFPWHHGSQCNINYQCTHLSAGSHASKTQAQGWEHTHQRQDSTAFAPLPQGDQSVHPLSISYCWNTEVSGKDEGAQSTARVCCNLLGIGKDCLPPFDTVSQTDQLRSGYLAHQIYFVPIPDPYCTFGTAPIPILYCTYTKCIPHLYQLCVTLNCHHL